MERDLHVVMVPWLAFGHMIPFFNLSTALAKQGIRVSFISTPKNTLRLPKPPPNLAPLINLVDLCLPAVAGLPEGAEATIDVSFDEIQHLNTAYDLLQPQFRQFIANESPDWIIHDFVPYWTAEIAREFGIPQIFFSVFSAATLSFFGPPEYLVGDGQKKHRPSPESLTFPPEWITFPSSVAYRKYEANDVFALSFGQNASVMTIGERLSLAIRASEAVAVRSCSELEADYLNIVEKIYRKPVIPVGFLPLEKTGVGEGEWVEIFKWLDKQKPKSVVFVGFGSEAKLSRDQVYEIAHGLQLSNLPFLWALRSPMWALNGDDALPSDFQRTIGGRGVVVIGWVPQLEILAHPSICGSLVHSGWGSIVETLQHGHTLVVLPLGIDQGLNARLLVEKGLAVEVERSEDGSFDGSGIAKALRKAMVEEEGERIRVRAREAGTIFGDLRLHQEFYIDGFIQCLKKKKAIYLQQPKQQAESKEELQVVKSNPWNWKNTNNEIVVLSRVGQIPIEKSDGISDHRRVISSCLKTVSTNATTVASTVRSAGASVAASISVAPEDHKDQVLWAGFDKLELGTSASKHVLLLGYTNGFQVLDVEDASNVSELVSKHDDPVTFLQMQPIPEKSSEGHEGFRTSHPLLLVVAGDESNSLDLVQRGSHLGGLVGDVNIEPQSGNCVISPTAVRFYSLRSHSYVHVLRFRSTVYMVRCSPRIVAVGLAAQIYCFDARTLENKFSVLTCPVPQVGTQGMVGVNIGYGPMAVGPRWLAYASNNPLLLNTGRLSPQNLTPSPGVSPSTSPSSGSLVARYAVESSKHLAAGIINLGDMGYKTLSKYCQDLLPDGSNSPASSNSSWKVGRVATHSTETDTTGVVIVKDFISRAVISQFRAHTSPISALCFDPSGTLLVTASVHGNNINIFRIMASCLQKGSGTQSYDWSSSHVHLYKLYRGITTAGDRPTLLPVLSLPWWSTSSCMINQQSFPPPSPITLSVVSRIKNAYSGWLNTVSNAAASATGKVSVPSGAVAAVFHNSVFHSIEPVCSKVNALEHLLVYTPSGHVIQHELRPSMGVEPNDGKLGTGPGSSVLIQDEELRVKVEPFQWWDVCRRSDRPEREECISGITLDRQEAAEKVISDCVDNDTKCSMELNNCTGEEDLVRPYERSHWYLSNAEVQISSGRMPIWQKSKICFHMMSPLRANERTLTKDYAGGEIEIEKVPVHEVEIRRKDLLPVFDHCRSIQSDWNNRGLFGGRYASASSSGLHRAKDKVTEETVICCSKPASVGSVESSDGGSSRTTEKFLDLDQPNTVKSYAPVCQTMSEIDGKKRGSNMVALPLLDQSFSDRDKISCLSEQSEKYDSHVEDKCITNGESSIKSNSLLFVGSAIAGGASSSNTGGTSEVSNVGSDDSASSMNILAEGSVPVNLHGPLDFGQYFQEEYCKASEIDECHELTEVATDADSSNSHYEREKPEEDGDNDDMLGGIFAFSEEGKESEIT
ncbi:hypothetical protein HHK36_022859 [Tetracentron sinense]|nr:hypothetical protein HHK36_022859 [Tetracentron sinense]